ncbi:MAG TPA: formylglycine-generating enzyme family protein [Pyrinomonadaceae bacterium]|nr:formylglycine-generating enzyme family protein [Pyrinomonadaceae bacterium]
MQLLERLQQIRRKLLIVVGVLLAVLVVLIAVIVVVGLFLWSSDSRKAAQIKKNRIGMEFVTVPAGSFAMGSATGRNNEKPVHRITITQGFLMGRYEVTAGEWKTVMNREPNSFKGDLFPVQFVSWNEAQVFIRKLNQMNDGYSYRLPTEAEWEYACRAGTTGEYADDLNWIAWYDINSDFKVHKVGYKHPNAWGLYDMEGNLWEYCQDWYSEDYYSQSSGTDPQGPASGQQRVQRGGSFSDLGPMSNEDHGSNLRSTARSRTGPDGILDNQGFRIVAVALTNQGDR